MAELHEHSAVALREALRRRELSPAEIVDHYLDRIERQGPGLGAFTALTPEQARTRAQEPGLGATPLGGLPLADKDLVARRGVPTRYGSRLFADHVPTASDALADALDRAGGISLGKTSTPEFGLTGYTESAVSPPARDPWDPAHGAGGSSGGAAVAVAAGLLPVTTGSDGGGSIRIPAATCGVLGLKPSRGRVPTGSGQDSPTGLSVVGPLARSAEDAALLLDALTGTEPAPFALRAPGAGPFLAAAHREPGRLRIALTTATPWDDARDIALAPEHETAFHDAARLLEGEGHEIVPLGALPGGYAELFPRLWRVSAARLPVAEADLDRVEPITAWLIREGRSLSGVAVLEALGDAARYERALLASFAPYDAVLTPALAQDPLPVGSFDADDAEHNFWQQVDYAPYSSMVNVAGLPAVTLPVRRHAGTGHPVSAQLIGRPGGEGVLLSLAAQIERLRGPLPHPPLW